MLYNNDYGRLTQENNLEYAPKNLEVEGSWYIPATGEQLIQAGYYEIVDTPYPVDGKVYEYHWEISGTQLVKV